MAVTFSQADVDAFKAAMLKNPGVLEMRIADQLYKFSSLKEMEERLAYMQRNIDTGTAGRIRYVSTSKGF